jgi:hypothetical protein
MDDMEGYRSLFERRKLLNSAVSLASIGAQFVTSLFMASSQEKASWNDEETKALVDYLWERRAECGDGGTFKATVFNAIPNQIANLLTSGPTKTATHCRTKYTGVSICFKVSSESLNTDIIHSLKPSFEQSSHIGILHLGITGGITRKVQTLMAKGLQVLPGMAISALPR